MSRNGFIESSLAAVCSLVTDGTHDTPTPVENGYPLIKAKEIVGGRIDFETCDHISKEEHLEVIARSKPERGDTLFAHIGASLGEAAYVNTSREFSIKNIALFKPNPAVIDGRYLYYLVISPEFQAIAKGTKTGSAQPFLSLGQLRSHRIRFHRDLSVQRRIVGILSAYDELIENNQRRIGILEEMARTLYREWFVNFRFPGHETVPLGGSPLGDIPIGWEVKPMQEVADVIDCLHSKKPAECAEGQGILLQLNNIGEAGKLDMREQFRISAEDYELWTSRIELHAGDCVVTNVGRVGAVAQIPERVKAAPGRNMTAIRARAGKLTPSYLIEYLLSSHMASEVAKKKDLGTIMDSLNVKGIIRLHVPCPPIETMLRFESIARPIRRRIELLVEQIQNLRRTRDLLLPRLLSGALIQNEALSSTGL